MQNTYTREYWKRRNLLFDYNSDERGCVGFDADHKMKLTRREFLVGSSIRLNSESYIRDERGDVGLDANPEMKHLFTTDVSKNVETISIDEKILFFLYDGTVYTSKEGNSLVLCEDGSDIDFVDGFWTTGKYNPSAYIIYRVGNHLHGILRITKYQVENTISSSKGNFVDIQFDKSKEFFYVTEKLQDRLLYKIVNLGGSDKMVFDDEMHWYNPSAKIVYTKNKLKAVHIRFASMAVDKEVVLEDGIEITDVEVNYQNGNVFLLKVITNVGIIYYDKYLSCLTSPLSNSSVYNNIRGSSEICYILNCKHNEKDVYTDVYFIDGRYTNYISEHISCSDGIKMIQTNDYNQYIAFLTCNDKGKKCVYSSSLKLLFENVDDALINIDKSDFNILLGLKDGVPVNFCEYYVAVEECDKTYETISLEFICSGIKNKTYLLKGNDDKVYEIYRNGKIRHVCMFEDLKEYFFGKIKKN